MSIQWPASDDGGGLSLVFIQPLPHPDPPRRLAFHFCPSWQPGEHRRLDVVGGKYPQQESRDEKDTEYNFMADAASTALFYKEWPTAVLFNGEGGSTNSGRRVTYQLPEHNPLTMA